MDRTVAGMVLTGGASRRMGRDKATMVVAGRGLAAHVAAVLAEVCEPVVEVGPGVTGLPCTREDPVGGGPLAAVAAGWDLLVRLGARRPVLVAACDLPRLRADVVRALAGRRGEGTVVPLVGGEPQPLCARWSVPALEQARECLATTRSVRHLARRADTELLDASVLGEAAEAALADVDTMEELGALDWIGWGSRPHAAAAATAVESGPAR